MVLGGFNFRPDSPSDVRDFAERAPMAVDYIHFYDDQGRMICYSVLDTMSRVSSLLEVDQYDDITGLVNLLELQRIRDGFLLQSIHLFAMSLREFHEMDHADWFMRYGVSVNRNFGITEVPVRMPNRYEQLLREAYNGWVASVPAFEELVESLYTQPDEEHNDSDMENIDPEAE